MEKLIHSIQINVFEKKEENLESVKSSFSIILPIDYKKEKIEINYEKLEGFRENIIHSFTLIAKKQRHIKIFIENLFTNLHKKDIEKLKNEIDSRLNDEGFFYIRLDKQSFLKNRIILTDSGDCFHFKIKLAAYPAKRSIFIDSIKKIIEMYEQ